MEFRIDNLVLVKRNETYSGITTDGLVQIDSETRQIRIFCEDRMTQFIFKADEISPHLEDSVGEIILRFKPGDPQQKVLLKLSMSTKERYFVSTSFKLQKGVPLPPIRCHLSLEEGALVLVLEPGNQLMAIPYNTIMPFTVPKMASAKKITFDLQNHERYSQVSMVFEKSEQLKHVCELASQHIKVCTPKKATASQFTRQVESSSRGPPARSSASVPTTPSYTATVNSYSSTLQSNKSPRPSPLRLSSTPNRTTADALAEAWNSERNDEPTSSVRQNSARYGTSNNIGPRKRGFVPVIVESEIEPVDSGRVEPVEKRESETKRARNDDVVTLDDDVPASNEDGFTIDEDEKKEEESNGRTLRRETNMTSPVKDTKSCWPTRRYGTSVFSFRSMANLGNSCYMNASLQALASLPLFVDGLFKAVPRKCNNRTELLISVVNVYRHIFTPLALQLDRTKRIDTKTRYLGKIGAVPRLALEKVRKAAGEQIDEDMASRTQQDAQEFVGRLLDIIHDEIDGKSPLPKRESPSSDKENQEFVENDLVLSPVTRKPSRKSMEHRNIQMPWKKNMPKLREQAAAPVNPGKLFKVDCYNRLLCNGCGNVEKKEESAYEVQLGFDGKSTISALLEAQFELHDVDWKCPTCSATASTASTSFHNVPEYLVIVLKRYGYDMSGGTKSNKKIDPHLYLGDMCDGSAKKNTELEKKSLDFSQGDANLEAKSEVVPDSVQNTPVKAFMRSPEKFPRGFVNSSPMKSAQRVRHPSHENNEPGPNGSQGSNDLFISEEEPEKYDPVSHIDDVKRVYHPDISLTSTPDKPASPPPQISDDEEEVEEVANVPMEYHRTEGPSYTLSAIVNHQGASLSHGHYTAYSFDLDRKIWYKCDDSSISEVRLDCVLEHSKSTCYLLMYRRRHPGDEDQF